MLCHRLAPAITALPHRAVRFLPAGPPPLQRATRAAARHAPHSATPDPGEGVVTRTRACHMASTVASDPAMSMLDVKPGVTSVGWVGTGVMGAAMAGHIQAAGYKLTVYNRTASKADGLKAGGAHVAGSPADVAKGSDVVFTIVGYPSDVREVILGPAGILANLRPGGIAVDMTTSQPSLAREIAEVAESRGCHAVDAPVSGGDKGARAATLAIMAGGDEAAVAAVGPLFRCMGTATYLGPPGAGQSCKMANQVTIASTMVGMVEGMLYASRAGLDVPTCDSPPMEYLPPKNSPME